MLGSRADFNRQLLRWYDRMRRDLPWRAGPNRTPTPYEILVSELMLQQTQVATVIPYFHRFVARFPTIAELAAADEQEVLRYWQGLGYYSRARNLLMAARQVMEKHRGELPGDVEPLLTLRGIGRYTAGAVSSIAFNRRAPILDGNVSRVLCRLDKIETDPRERSTQSLLWQRAEELLPRKRIGDFNSAMMELGALICSPRSPQCLLCPVRAHCAAFAAGVIERIPVTRIKPQTPLVERNTFCIRRGDRWLIEQRPGRGRWASMWQFITRPSRDEPPTKIAKKRKIGTIAHALTHRRYRFDVYLCDAAGTENLTNGAEHRWTTLQGLAAYPMPRPHLRMAEMLSALP
jgi:A/G-specific adenine glycosylase